MTDLERAADLVARAVPTGFSTPEDNARCCAIIDSLATEILNLKGDLSDAGKGLRSLLQRAEERQFNLAVQLSDLQREVRDRETADLFARTEELLATFR